LTSFGSLRRSLKKHICPAVPSIKEKGKKLRAPAVFNCHEFCDS
jgi:hypothetical protein